LTIGPEPRESLKFYLETAFQKVLRKRKKQFGRKEGGEGFDSWFDLIGNPKNQGQRSGEGGRSKGGKGDYGGK